MVFERKPPSVQHPITREIPKLNLQKRSSHDDWSLNIGASLEVGAWTLGAFLDEHRF
jgi:hypothetical protein